MGSHLLYLRLENSKTRKGFSESPSNFQVILVIEPALITELAPDTDPALDFCARCI